MIEIKSGVALFCRRGGEVAVVVPARSSNSSNYAGSPVTRLAMLDRNLPFNEQSKFSKFKSAVATQQICATFLLVS